MKYNLQTLGIIAIMLLAALLGVLTGGCTVSRFHTPSGGEYVNKSFLWKRDAAHIHLGTNGTIDVDLLGSSSDSAALKAVASGVAEGTVVGMSKAVKPTP